MNPTIWHTAAVPPDTDTDDDEEDDGPYVSPWCLDPDPEDDGMIWSQEDWGRGDVDR